MTVFTLLNASAAVKAILGTSPLRVFPAGEAPENVAKPYATYAVYNGVPENQLGTVPDVDNDGIQIDVWGVSVASVALAADAIRDVLELSAHQTGYDGPVRDAETRLYHKRMDFDFFTDRP